MASDEKMTMREAAEKGLTSQDIPAEKRAQLRSIFPEVFTEDKIDFEQLRRVLGDWAEPGKERFGLTWPGKADCMKAIQAPSTAALKPVRDESVNFDETENIFIEGDNLEVLKLLQKAYFGKIKMIYIDPPYNTGNEFIYPDKFSETLETYLLYTGQIDGNGHKFSTNTEADGRYHSRWLNMMYPRLYLARNLLHEEGVVVVHIDEHEAIRLQVILDEIFGAENSLGSIIWDKKNPKGDATKIAVQHETVLAYARNLETFTSTHTLKTPKENAPKMLAKCKRIFSKLGKKDAPSDLKGTVRKYELDVNLGNFAEEVSLEDVNSEFWEWAKRQKLSAGESPYKHIDKEGVLFRTASMAWPNKEQAPDDYFVPLIHPKTGKPCPVPEKGWRNPSKTMQYLLKKKLIVFGADETKQPERKYRLEENMDENVSSVLPHGGSDDNLLKELGIPFDNPKPVEVARRLLCILQKEDVVLDFFAGSCTTAHAVMQMNLEDGGRRKYIMVQLPELTQDKSKAAGAGYKNIAEIGKDRIRNAAKKIEDERNGKLDLGFRTFNLTRSNFRIWDGDVEKSYSLEEQLESHIDHVDSESSPEDILYELLLKAGYELTTKAEKQPMAGKNVYAVDGGALLICLEKEITEALIDAMAEADPRQVICLDEGFKGDDQLKTNAVQTFKSRAESEESAIIFKTV